MEGLITGIVVGFIASKIYSGSGKGCLINLLLGIVGGWVGGRLFSWCGITATGLVGNIVRTNASISGAEVGCQGVYRQDVAPGVNFGAYTTNRPAAAMKALGVSSTIIGHCEERADKLGVLQEAGVSDTAAVNRLLNKEIACAAAQGMSVTYCIGEKAEERVRWQEVLAEQLAVGLAGIDKQRVIIAYEPIWAIGPGKTPPGADVIAPIARFIKDQTGGMPVVYGGGLKQDNAAMLASIPEIDGGLIALTRFQGEIGFYPDEYLDIIRIYMQHCAK